MALVPGLAYKKLVRLISRAVQRAGKNADPAAAVDAIPQALEPKTTQH